MQCRFDIAYAAEWRAKTRFAWRGDDAKSQLAWRQGFVLSALLAVAALAISPSALAAPEPAQWQVIGQQGLVQIVIVPAQQSADRKAYEQQIVRLCDPERTCFLNLYTNTTAAAPAVPLPDAIANEATATYRRSVKQGAQVFTWSCRLKVPSERCF